jgi:hypothetical protein
MWAQGGAAPAAAARRDTIYDISYLFSIFYLLFFSHVRS